MKSNRSRQLAVVSRETNKSKALNFSSDPFGLAASVGHPVVSRCLNFLARNFTRPIQIKDLVDISGMSRRGLLKAFEKHAGVNPGAVLRQARIEHAKRLLTEQDLPLKAIAVYCGYHSMNSFCVSFSRFVGLAPKQFQKQVLLASHRRLQTKLKILPAVQNRN
jgi:transcriptional regulator GlxA family with amidase domain